MLQCLTLDSRLPASGTSGMMAGQRLDVRNNHYADKNPPVGFGACMLSNRRPSRIQSGKPQQRPNSGPMNCLSYVAHA